MTNNHATSLDVINAAKIVFEAAGVKGSRLALALDKIYQRHTGYSALEVGKVKVFLTPAEIGEHFGLTARRVNEILAGAGYQYKPTSKWEALPLGEPYAVMLDVGKSHSDGTPIRQLKWDSSILDVFEQLQCDEE